VINPKMIHIGHDEWRMPMDVCPNCKGKDYTELFVSDVNKIYSYLMEKNIKVAMWGDHLLESVRNKGFRDRESSSGYKYKIPGALSPQQVQKSIPKDILVFNWFWGEPENDLKVQNFGFKQVYGNFRPNISSWEKRRNLSSVLGGAPSSWAATNEFNFGKDQLYDFLGCAQLLWSNKILEQNKLAHIVYSQVPSIRKYLSKEPMPSQDDNVLAPIQISNYFNASVRELSNVNLETIKTGKVQFGLKNFVIKNPNVQNGKIAAVVQSGFDGDKSIGKEVNNIRINEDVNSLIFLHACAKPANNEKAYRMIYNFDDTADLLGWYEVVYEDDFMLTIPIRYGVNILEWNVKNENNIDKWAEGKTGSPQNFYCYYADAVDCSRDMKRNPVTFFAYE
jgi:hypothetical protein